MPRHLRACNPQVSSTVANRKSVGRNITEVRRALPQERSNHTAMQTGATSYPGHVAGESAGEDEALDALLQAGNVLDLQEVALNSAQELGVLHALVLRMLALQPRPQNSPW